MLNNVPNNTVQKDFNKRTYVQQESEKAFNRVGNNLNPIIMLTLEVKPVCSGPASGKSATVVYKDGKMVGFFQPTSLDNPISGGPCYPTLFVVYNRETLKTYLCDCLEQIFNSFGVFYPETNDIKIPAGVYNEFAWK